MKYNYTIPAGAAYYPLCKELITAPNALIAGTVGSGKSTFLHSIIYTQLASAPADLVLIDPKRVELGDYKLLPFCTGYANTAEKTLEYMNRIIEDIEKRFVEMQRRGLKKYDGSHGYLIIDELADLMISEYATKIKRAMQKILQIGRAANWHIIACTQCPNRKIIPAELTLNFTNRIALHCISAIESRQIVGVKGAEDLPEHGKGLYMRNGKITEVDIPMTEERDITKRVTYWLNSDNIEVVNTNEEETEATICYTSTTQKPVINATPAKEVKTTVPAATKTEKKKSPYDHDYGVNYGDVFKPSTYKTFIKYAVLIGILFYAIMQIAANLESLVA